MKRAARLAVPTLLTLLAATAGLTIAALPVGAGCHLPAPGHCAAGSLYTGACPWSDGAVRVECPKTEYGQLDAVELEIEGIIVSGQAYPTVLVEKTDSAHEYPIGSHVTLVVSARWQGNGSHPDRVRITYSFDAREVNWTSHLPASDGDAAPGADARRFPTYSFDFADWSGANITYRWSFHLPASVREGALRLPVAAAVRYATREVAVQSDMVLTIVSQEQSVLPPPPFWRDPAFILGVGVAIGVAVGYIVFGKPRPAAQPQARHGPFWQVRKLLRIPDAS